MPTNSLGGHDCVAREQPTDAAYTCPECGEVWTWWELGRTWETEDATLLRQQMAIDMAAPIVVEE